MTDSKDDILCDDECFQHDLGRREFGALALGAGVMAASGARAAVAVKENEVNIKTPDGTADGIFVHPTSGPAPGVLIWTDIMGLRPAFRDMAKRLAGEGYAVLCPNPFYRTGKAPTFGPDFDITKDADRNRAMEVSKPLRGMGVGPVERDATAYVNWLDSQDAVKKTAKIGTTGYCMGGPLVMRTAATLPNRIGSVNSFHGGGLVTKEADSPHLSIPKMKADFLICVADNDDKGDPTAKETLKTSFAAAKLPAEIEVYTGAMHGWCVPGSRIYNEAAAEKAWGRLLVHLKKSLV